jgi:hypothetical protein
VLQLPHRHSSKTQDSDAYNKAKSDRLMAAAVKMAEDFAATFMAGQSHGKGRM